MVGRWEFLVGFGMVLYSVGGFGANDRANFTLVRLPRDSCIGVWTPPGILTSGSLIHVKSDQNRLHFYKIKKREKTDIYPKSHLNNYIKLL